MSAATVSALWLVSNALFFTETAPCHPVRLSGWGVVITTLMVALLPRVLVTQDEASQSVAAT